MHKSLIHSNWGKNTLLAIVLLMFGTHSLGKNLAQFERIDSSLDIQSNYVNKIIQRQDGFIWMATAEGVSRFDGYSFKNYWSDINDPGSLPAAWVDVLFEDSKQRLWVGTDRGLARLAEDERTFEVFKYDAANENSLSGNFVHGITEDGLNRIWVSADLSINLYQENSNDFIRYPIPGTTKQQIADSGINFVKSDKKHGLWIGSDLGLYYFDTRKRSFTKHTEVSRIGEAFYDLDTDSDGNLWLTTRDKGVIKYNPSTFNQQIYTATKGNPNSLVSNLTWRLLVDSNNQVWIATSGNGLSILDVENNKFSSHQYSLVNEQTIPSDLVTDIIEDDSGLIWVATFDGVAIYQPNQVVENLRPVPYDEQSLSSDLSWSFAETSEGIWIGTTEGLNREDKLSGKIKRYANLGSDRIRQKFTAIWAIERASEKTLWLATEYGLASFDIPSETFRFAHALAKNNLDSKQLDLLKRTAWALKIKQDGSVWVGTNDGKLYLYSQSGGVILDLSDNIWNSLTEKTKLEFNNIIEDENGNLWLSTSAGFYFYDLAENSINPVIDSSGRNIFPNDWIYATEKHSNHHYWVLTQNYGAFLLRLNDDGSVSKKIHINSDTKNLNDNNLYNVFPINQQEVWFTAARNIYRYNIETNQLLNYGSEQLISDLVFHENTQFIDSNKRLHFGSSKGVIRFSPKALKYAQKKRKDFIPPLYITELSTNIWNQNVNGILQHKNAERFESKQKLLDKPIYKYQSIDFPYQHNVLNFEFLALDYANIKDLQYSYRLLGFDESWTDYSNRRKITYTNLDAGEYILQIRAASGIYNWSNKPTELKIFVHSAPWRTWQAYLGYFLSVLLILLIIYRFWRKQLLTQYALDTSQVKLQQALWGSGDELWEWNIQTGKLNKQNTFSEFVQTQRIDPHTLSSLIEQIHPEDAGRVKIQIRGILDGKEKKLESLYRRKTVDGGWVWLLDRAKVSLYSENGEPIKISGTTRNVDSLKQTEEKNRLLASAFQSTSDGAIILSQELRILSINNAFTRITGYKSSAVGKVFNSRLISSTKSSLDGDFLGGEIMKNIISHGSYNCELWITTYSGKRIPVEMRMAAVGSGLGEVANFVVTITDIKYRKDAEIELRRLADFDSLTSLPNRAKFIRQLDHDILEAQRDESILALLFIDLDNFKNVNDSLGHSIGDLLLVVVAKRLKQCVRSTDVVARLGGDEFTIGLVGVESIESVTKAAVHILNQMRAPFSLGEHELTISPSIGISIYGTDGDDVETLLRNADIAMYHAKNHGKNNFEFFTQSMNERVFNRIALEKRVRKALQKGEFLLYYQPKFGLLSGEVVGFEALVRWADPEHGIIPPDKFIPIAEETGLILPLGSWVINAACKQLNHWNSLGYNNLNLAVNLSALQFQDKDLIKTVRKALIGNKIKVSNFELEITESSLMEDMDYTIKTLNALKEFGLRLSLDDFGTGYSSLNYLKRFPIQSLKIDRTFVSDLTKDKRDAKMVASIVSLAHNLDLKVIGEGVEDREQLAMLHQFGVDEVQGFLLGRPCSADIATRLLDSNVSISEIIQPINYN